MAKSKYLKLLSLTKINFKILKAASIVHKITNQDVLESSPQNILNNWVREIGVWYNFDKYSCWFEYENVEGLKFISCGHVIDFD